MSDEPLPVTLDNIRKWDADMRGSDDRARHIALYYFATNLREVVEMLFAELAEARDKALEEAAGEVSRQKWSDTIITACDRDGDEGPRWFNDACDECEKAIRALKSRKGTGDE